MGKPRQQMPPNTQSKTEIAEKQLRQAQQVIKELKEIKEQDKVDMSNIPSTKEETIHQINQLVAASINFAFTEGKLITKPDIEAIEMLLELRTKL